jgi:hypothetical protein
MRKLEAADLLSLWERGAPRHPLDRGALLCAWARPDVPADAIADLPLGEVTTSLLRFRAALFGDRISAHLDCEHCGERLQLAISVAELLQTSTAPTSSELCAAGLHLRLPCLRDLAAIGGERDSARAAHQLLARCLLDGGDPSTLPDASLCEVERTLEAADPNADLAFDVRCEACGRLGTAQLDAAELLWDEIVARVRALLTDVHALARAYGWTEAEIVALGAQRRAVYLSLVRS